MQAGKSIEHKGTVEAIEDGLVKVNILSQSACSSCHAKGACSVADMENKIIDVQTPGNQYKIGERVNVVMQQSQGFKALLLGYVLPFVIVITFLVVGTIAGLSEGKAGLIALAVLPIYYLGLYLSNNKLKQTFSFRIQKLD
ncbi:MAG: SoxR reducing system RseC family protein [Bacteroidales bacterium]|nr:SoxR reducing system RseC family protein [Bacteroidales bacterium]MCF8458882.1 SoxR reducing system RseC family protein [Bacteroidales bacterium]